jgi:Cu(I)/Ag(I) efflux system membrane fusion protein
MRRAFFGLMSVGLGVAIGAGAYWLALHGLDTSSGSAAVTASEAAAAERQVLYYRDPMGKPYYSAEPKKDSMGMDYIPVYEGEDDSVSRSSPALASASGGKGRILYYRNPMGLPDTSPVPKKDSMGMDYIPVTEGEETDDTGTVKISPDRVQKLGVQSASVETRVLARTIRAVGTVQPDERRLYIVNTKFEGWIERLNVNATGQTVMRGQPLMEVYAPELVVAEREYLLAWRSLQDMAGARTEIRNSARQLAEAALQRLQNWDISPDQIKRLERSGTVTRTLTLRAPADGTVMEKMAVEGMRFAAGDPLYRIADLSTVWVNADVFEQDIGALRIGQEAKIEVSAYPGAAFTGTVDFIYPTVSQETRTGKVRIVVRNTDGHLKTGMYANVAIEAGIGDRPVLAVPDSAVIDSGTRQAVLIERGGGKFEPREVKLGAHADGFYEVRQGLSAGERVVVSANFLIDAESNLRAALKGFTPPDSAGGKPQPPPAPEGGKP